jgi:hypothetical protein
MNNLAKVEIWFNSEMKTDFNKSMINETVLDIYVKTNNNWHEDYEQFEVNATLNMTTWQVDKFVNNKLIIELNFKKPYHLSPNLEKDVLVIFFKNIQKMFISAEYL